jgi:phospholipid/cholesterol/gamma-HCH transport system substrate-binding protein
MTMNKNAKVGLFIIIGVVLFAAGLFMIGSHNQVFGHHYDVYTEFAKVDTLHSGAKIRVSGMDAGEVSDIQIPQQPSGKFRLKLHIDEKFRNVVRKDSVASIETEGMVGNKFVNISKGTNGSPECVGNCILPSQEPVEIGDLMRKGKDLLATTQTSITDLQQRADSTIGHVDGMIVSMNGNLQHIAAKGAHITDQVSSVIAGVQSGQGTVGKFLTDEQMAKNVEDMIAQAKQTSTNIEQASNKANDMVSQLQNENIPQDVHQTVANARDMSRQLKTSLDGFLTGGGPNQNTGEVLRQTIDEAHQATTNLAADTEAIKHNFFLRGFFHRRGFYSLHFNPTKYDASEFVKHPAKRIWLPADGLFSKSSSGSQQLSSEGRSAVDHAVSEIADELPNNPVMIEGYSDNGSPSQRYLAASQRAAAVKKYLEAHYQLKPDLIGTIPLDDKPPRGTGKESWNGICLALVASRK